MPRVLEWNWYAYVEGLVRLSSMKSNMKKEMHLGGICFATETGIRMNWNENKDGHKMKLK